MPVQWPFCPSGWSKMLQFSENVCEIFESLGLCDVYMVPFGDDSYSLWGNLQFLFKCDTKFFWSFLFQQKDILFAYAAFMLFADIVLY